MSKYVKEISVEGLHGRISFNIKLKPDLNIIYGKNGLGKTTLLHIIANIAEGDLSRFAHLSFSTIKVKNNEGETLILAKSGKGSFSAFFNEEAAYQYLNPKADSSIIDAAMSIEQDMSDKVRLAFGDRPCYLPAFRSVLERSRDIYQSSTDEARNPAFDELVKQEEKISRSAQLKKEVYYTRDLTARNTAFKTIRCRGWFGNMVPVIRYPSIADVSEALGEEWNFANYKTSRLEQDQYEEAFLRIFETILLERPSTSGTGDQTDILANISQLLNDETIKARSGKGNATYERLVDVAQRAGVDGTKYNSVLEIYWKLLETRKSTRELEFKPIVDFEGAVNTFLDGKELKIGADAELTERRIARAGEKVRIYPEHGKSYPLRALSSGERQIATMLFAASRSSLTPGTLLIDEPELSLHVDWQRHILKELKNQNFGRQIIACTHSPEVGADHKKNIIMFRPKIFDTYNEDQLDDQIGEENE